MGIVIYVDVKICNNNIIKDRAACGKKKKRLGQGREINKKFSGGIMKVEGNMEECHESKEDNYFETVI